jgi:hypothetical protein
MGPGARIGFHAAYVNENGQAIETGVGNAVLGAYLNKLGLTDRAIIFITQAHPNQLTWLTIADATREGIDVELFSMPGDAPVATPSAAPTSPVTPEPSGAALCAMTKSSDEVKPIPQPLTAFANTLFGYGGASRAFYRCIHGRVYICDGGNGFSCDKPNTDSYNPGAVKYCRENPNDVGVPMVETGHSTIHLWKCVGGRAVITYTERVDDQGYRADMWTALPGLQ